jgi:hypothetical protein
VSLIEELRAHKTAGFSIMNVSVNVLAMRARVNSLNRRSGIGAAMLGERGCLF